MILSLVVLLLFIGLLLIAIDVVKVHSGYYTKDPKIIYKYIPRTFQEEQEDPVAISDIFDTMFSQPSPWLGSIRNYDLRKQDNINKYFVTQL